MLASEEFRILYAFLLLLVLRRAFSLELREGQACPAINNYPASTCTGLRVCRTLDEHFQSGRLNIRTVPHCGMSPFTELICCPNSEAEISPNIAPPSRTFTTTAPQPVTEPTTPQPVTKPTTPQPVTKPTTPQPVNESVPKSILANNLDSFGHIVAFRYYKDDHMDSYKYKCTGILISDSLVLTTTVCKGDYERELDIPDKVVIGLKGGQHQFSEISGAPRVHNNDLVIYQMKTKLNQTKAPGAKIATICSPTNTEYSKLFAVGFAQNQGENCGLFKQEMQHFNEHKCSYVNFQKGFEVNTTGHLCLSPIPNMGIHTQCANCLRGSASVLHLERPDNSVCVVGFATPTSNDCLVTNENRPLSSPLYYTNLQEESVRNFVNNKINSNQNDYRNGNIYKEKI